MTVHAAAQVRWTSASAPRRERGSRGDDTEREGPDLGTAPIGNPKNDSQVYSERIRKFGAFSGGFEKSAYNHIGFRATAHLYCIKNSSDERPIPLKLF